MNVAELLRVAEENLAFDAAEEAERDRKDEDRVKKCGLLKKVCLMILPKQCLWFCFGSCFMLNSSAVNERPPPLFIPWSGAISRRAHGASITTAHRGCIT